MHRLSLRLFGAPQAVFSANVLTAFPAKGFVLAAFLTTRVRWQASRAEAATFLWEDKPASQAYANLRQLLASIRRLEATYGVAVIHTDRAGLALADDIVCDRDALLACKAPADATDLSNFISRFGPDFLAHAEEGAGEELRRWIEAERQSLSARFIDAAREGAIRVGGAPGAEALRRLLVREPYDEVTFRALARLLIEQEATSSVVEEFRRFAARLQRDLQMSPEPETLSLMAQAAPRDYMSWQSKVRLSASEPVAGYREPLSTPQPAQNQRQHGIPRLMILPPEESAFGNRPAELALARALVDDVTLNLCRMRSFAMFAPHTARQISGGACATLDFGKQPHYLVSTHLFPSSGDSGGGRLTFSLREQASGRIVLADELRFSVTDIAGRYRDLVRVVAGNIASEIEHSVLSDFRVRGSASAYTYFLLGRERMKPYDLRSVRASRHAFQRALRLEPGFYPAQQLLARTLSLEWFLLGRPDRDLLLQARQIGSQLIEADPFAPGGHWELATSALYLGDLDAATQHLADARERAPHHADILADEADALVHKGRHRKAQELIQTALELNPLPPDDYYWIRASSDFMLGHYTEALAALSKVRLWQPVLRLFAACHAMLGNAEKAAFYRDRYLCEYPDFRVRDWTRLVPLRERSDVDHYVSAMRMAGFE